MKAAADLRSVYRPPGGRTERDVAAQVIARLLEAGVLTRSPGVLARAAAAVGVPVTRVREAWATGAKLALDDTPVVAEGRLPQSFVNAKTPEGRERQQRWNRVRHAAKEPVPGKRKCSGCGELKDKTEFRVKNYERGWLTSRCIPCLQAYQQERYLSSETKRKLGKALRFVLAAGDAHVGAVCPDCSQPCVPGDEVLAADAVLHHAAHHSE